MNADERRSDLQPTACSLQPECAKRALIRQCCKCKRLWDPVENAWVARRIPDEDRENVTHGLCDVCHALAIADVERWEKRMNADERRSDLQSPASSLKPGE